MDTDTAPCSLTRRRLLLAALGIAAVSLVPTAYAADEYAEISWNDLVPDDWDPRESFRDLEHLFDLPDSDVRTQELYDRVREVWDNAPTVPTLAGRKVTLPGYVVPLETDKTGLTEFLLVPYFGACIHTPPPPANQIVHVRSRVAIRGMRTMDAVRVSGELGLTRSGSSMGVSGYGMTANKVVKF